MPNPLEKLLMGPINIAPFKKKKSCELVLQERV
jgi:hypothetical protein